MRLLVLLLVMLPSHCFGEQLLEKVESDWQERHRRFGTVTYTFEGVCNQPKGSITEDASADGMFPKDLKGPLPASDYEYPAYTRLMLDFANNRARREVDRERFYIGETSARTLFIRDWHIDLFDGDEYQCYCPHERITSKKFKPSETRTELHLMGKTAHRGFYKLMDIPVLVSHGIVPSISTNMAVKEMSRSTRVANFSFNSMAKAGARECAVLEVSVEGKNPSDRTQQFWVDLERDSAVVRIIWLTGSLETKRLSIDYEENQHGWMPVAWSFTGAAGERYWETASVISAEYNKPMQLSDFRIEPRPGQVVKDYRTAKRRRYIQGKPGEPNKAVNPLNAIENPSNNASRYAFLVGNVLVIIGLLILRFVRSRN